MCERVRVCVFVGVYWVGRGDSEGRRSLEVYVLVMGRPGLHGQSERPPSSQAIGKGVCWALRYVFLQV